MRLVEVTRGKDMAGLLDFNLDDPQQAGMMALAQGLLSAGAPQTRRVGFGEALASGMGNMMQARQQAKGLQQQNAANDLAMKIKQFQFGGMQQDAAARQAQQEFQAQIPQIVQKFGKDYAGMRLAGVPQDLIEFIAKSGDLGLPEVARTVDIEGANGQKITRFLDKQNRQVGEDLNAYVAPVQVNTGNEISMVKPAAGLKFKMGLSPSDMAAEARSRAQMAQSERQYLGNQELKRQEIGMKQQEKQQEATQAKSGQVASFDTMLDSLDRIKNHPGLPRSVGLYSKVPTVPGSNSANFQAELDTFQSQAFIPMVSQLKGMGALSDAEGKKLTAAVGALNPAMSEKAFKDSLNRIQKDMEAARQRAIKGTNLPDRKPTGNSDIEALLGKYGG